MSLARLHADRVLARTGETVTIRQHTRSTTVDATTGQHTLTETLELEDVPVIIRDVDPSGTNTRTADQQRDLTDRLLTLRVPRLLEVRPGQTVVFTNVEDPDLNGKSGRVTGVQRPGRLYRRVTVQVVT